MSPAAVPSHWFLRAAKNLMDRDEVLDGFRWLTVGSPEQPDVELVLIEPNPPMFDPESAAQLRP